MKIRNTLFALPLCMVFMASCDKEAKMSYTVRNAAGTPIKVLTTNHNDGTVTDSFVIAPGTEQTIAVNDKGNDHIRNGKEDGVMLKDFSRMDVFRNDTVKTYTDFLRTEEWAYKETSDKTAEYRATVLDSDF